MNNYVKVSAITTSGISASRINARFELKPSYKANTQTINFLLNTHTQREKVRTSAAVKAEQCWHTDRMAEHTAIHRHESQPTGMCSLGCLSRATPTAGLARLGDDQNDDKNDSHKHRVHQHHRNDVLGISSVSVCV